MSAFRLATRAFSTSRPRLASTVAEAAAPAVPVKKPVGAFRGGIFGFLLGATVTGAASYFYVYEEYKLGNELLTEDIDALRSSIQRIETHCRALEDQIAEQAAQAKKVKH